MGYSSNSDLFAKLGNPWVSEREQMQDYKRRSFENPDLDRYLYATKADRPLDGIALDIKRIDANTRKLSAEQQAHKKAEDARLLRKRQMAGILNRMHAKMRGESR